MKKRTIKAAAIVTGVLAIVFLAVAAFKFINCMNYLDIMKEGTVSFMDNAVYIMDECAAPVGLACILGANAFLLQLFSGLGKK